MFKFRNIAILVALASVSLISAGAASNDGPGSPSRIHFQIVQTPNENQPYPAWNYLESIAASSIDDMWSVGASTIHYDGQTWTAFPAPHMTGKGTSLLTGVTDVSTTNVWAVGYINFQVIGKYESPIIERFDGTSWTIFPSPQFPAPDTASLNSVAAISADDIWAGGEVFEDPYALPLLEHFDGNSWTQFGPPVTDCVVWGISADATNDVWAVGSTLGGGTCALHYDGSAWMNVQSPDQCCGYNELNGVVALAPDNVWAAGWYIQSPTDDRPLLTLVEHWNGSKWEIVPSPNVGEGGKDSSRLRGIFSASATDIWAVGESTDIASDMSKTLVLHWNGDQWKIFPSPSIKYKNLLDDDLEGGIAVPQGDIWMVGSNNVADTLVMKGAR